MARFWKKDAKNRPNPLIPDWIYFVEVCSFTFEFRSVEDVADYLRHFSQKLRGSSADHASAKYPDSDWRREPCFAGDHWERQSCLDNLPLYLFEEPKRLEVVKALKRALVEFAE